MSAFFVLMSSIPSEIRLCKLQDMSFTIPSHEGEKLIRILEKQGDLCSSLKAYPRAIDFYQQMLQVQCFVPEFHFVPRYFNEIVVESTRTELEC